MKKRQHLKSPIAQRLVDRIEKPLIEHLQMIGQIGMDDQPKKKLHNSLSEALQETKDRENEEIEKERVDLLKEVEDALTKKLLVLRVSQSEPTINAEAKVEEKTLLAERLQKSRLIPKEITEHERDTTINMIDSINNTKMKKLKELWSQNSTPASLLWALLCLLLIFLFFWFQLRPAQIRKECYEEVVGMSDTNSEDAEVRARMFERYEKYYQPCLIKNGITK